jgi:hypothetical protein
MAGLLNMGGFGGNRPKGLLEYDPREQRNAMLKNGLLQMGISMLSQGPSQYPIGIGQSIGQGLGAGVQGAQQAKQDYRSGILENYQMSEAARKLKERQDREAEIAKILPHLSKEDQEAYRMAPDVFTEEYAKARFATPDNPSSYDEFTRAQTDPAYADFLTTRSRAGRPANFGTIPPGMMLKGDEKTGYFYEPIPGSAEANKLTQAQDAQQQEKTASDVVVQDIDRALGTIEKYPGRTTGPGGALLKNVPGTRAYNVSALIDTVKANAGFDRLQRMRESSPTGGALGNVSEKEIAYLQATIGNLALSQDDQQLADNLKRVKNAYLDIIHGPGQGPERAPLSFQENGGAAPGGGYEILGVED